MKISWNWGAGIAATYIVFAGATASFVVFASRQPVDLVSEDYYAEGLRQDERAEAVANAVELGSAVSIQRTDDGRLAIAIPPGQAASARGKLTLYRASDASADRTIDLAVDAQGHQTVPLALGRGLWSARLDWTAVGRHFYYASPLRIE